ncbi:WD40 repeat domain-containing protein [Streptomyces sp. NPDC026673]|uniref:WD40 repeat domain-containing protein n=1 Tax=Streptomyces sp. NPDC026673 TaxID=3155724 RepID=UPI0033E5E9F4
MTAPGDAAWPPLDDALVPSGRALLDWAADGTAPRLCLLTGGRGGGKSRLLAWYVTGSGPHPALRVHALVPAAGLTAEVFTWEMGRQLGYGPLDAPDVLRRLARDARPVLLAVPDLHQALGAAPAEIVGGLLGPLLRLPHVRLIVEAADSGTVGRLAPFREVALPGALSATEPAMDGEELAGLLASVPAGPAGSPDWERAPETVRARVLGLALATGTAGRLTGDPGFLVHGPAPAITAALADSRTPAPPGLRAVWRRAAPALTGLGLTGPERAAVLHAAALADDPKLAAYLAPLARGHSWTARWASPEPVTALTLGGDALLTADPVGRLRLLDPATGGVRRGVPADPAVRPVAAVSLAGSVLLLDGNDFLHPAGDVSVALSRIADVHNPAAAAPTALAACGRHVVVGDAGGRAHLWDVDAHDRGAAGRTLHPAPVTALALLEVPAHDLTFCLSGGADGTLRLWETGTDPMPEPVDRREAVVTALAASDTPAGPMVAAAWSDGELHLWNLFEATRRVLTPPHRAAALALAGDGTLFVAGTAGIAALHTRREAS